MESNARQPSVVGGSGEAVAAGGGLDGSVLAKFVNDASVVGVTTMNVSLPEELKSFVDAQAERGGYGSTSEFVRDLIRREQDGR